MADLPSAAICTWVFPTSTTLKARMLAVLSVPLVPPHAASPRHNATTAAEGGGRSRPNLRRLHADSLDPPTRPCLVHLGDRRRGSREACAALAMACPANRSRCSPRQMQPTPDAGDARCSPGQYDQSKCR